MYDNTLCTLDLELSTGKVLVNNFDSRYFGESHPWNITCYAKEYFIIDQELSFEPELNSHFIRKETPIGYIWLKLKNIRRKVLNFTKFGTQKPNPKKPFYFKSPSQKVLRQITNPNLIFLCFYFLSFFLSFCFQSFPGHYTTLFFKIFLSSVQTFLCFLPLFILFPFLYFFTFLLSFFFISSFSTSLLFAHSFNLYSFFFPFF